MKKNNDESVYYKQMNDIVFKMLCEVDRFCKKFNIKYYIAYGTLIGAVREHDIIPWDDDADVMITPQELSKVIEHKDDFDPDFQLVLPEDYGKNKYYDSVVRLNYNGALIKKDSAKERYYKGYRRKIGLDFFVLAPQPDGIKGTFNNFRLAFWYALANSYRYNCVLPHYSIWMKIAAKCLYPAGILIGLERIRKEIDKNIVRYENCGYTYVHNINAELTDLKCLYKKESFDSTVPVLIRDRYFPAPAGYDDVLRRYFGDYMQLPPEEKRRWHFADPGYFITVRKSGK